ncbi:hypothetical protein BsWGS_15807 [Bradybaena similaris]
MITILCLSLAFLHIHFAHSQFAGPQQPTTNGAFSTGTDNSGTQTGSFSPFPPNSSVTQTGFSTQTRPNDLSQAGGSSLSNEAINPFSQTGMSSTTQPNSSLATDGAFSPTQPGLSQTSISSPVQSNNQFSSTGFNSPNQTNSPTFQVGSSSDSTPGGFIPQNNNFSSPQPNISNTQPGVFSAQPQNDPFTQNNAFSASPTNSVIPTQPNSSIPQNGSALPNQLSIPATQNADIASQAGIASTPNNGFLPLNTDSSTAPTNIASTASNNSTSSQPGSPSSQGTGTPTTMLLVLATMLSGQYSNIEQHQDDNARNVTGPNKHAHIEVSYIPVVVPALGQAVVMYYEQRVNNSDKPTRQALYAFSQESSCLIRMSTYDIANSSRLSASPQGLQALETLTRAELTNRAECDAYWEQFDNEFFTSHLSTDKCTFEVSPRVVVRPSGSRNLTCSGMTFTEIWRRVAGNEVVGGSPVAYIFKKTGNAFPVPVSVFSSNACFKVPCVGGSLASPTGPSWGDIKQHMSYATNSGTGQSTSGL